MFDLVIRGGVRVDAVGTAACTIGIRGGRIETLAPPDADLEGRETLDASGKLLLPGLVDAHVHFREPGPVHKEGFASGSAAAAVGGVTTVMVMPTDDPMTFTPQQFEDKRRLAEGQCRVDFALQAALSGDVSAIPELVRLGAVSFELFLGDVPSPLTTGDTGVLFDALEALVEHGAIGGVTCNDDGLIAAMMRRYGSDPRPLAFARSRPPLNEALGVARACLVAEAVQARVHIRQVSCRQSLDLISAAKGRKASITAEVTPHNLLLTEDDLARQGPYAKIAPPLRPEEDTVACWEALRAGILDMVATDHAPHLKQEKDAGRDDIWAAPGGFPGVQTMLPLMLSQVARGSIGLHDVVRWCSLKPAQIFGLYPRKGSLEPGSDADIVIVDPDREWTIASDGQFSRAKYTPFEGRSIRGWPEMTLLRGTIIARDGKPVGEPTGRFVAPGDPN